MTHTGVTCGVPFGITVARCAKARFSNRSRWLSGMGCGARVLPGPGTGPDGGRLADAAIARILRRARAGLLPGRRPSLALDQGQALQALRALGPLAVPGAGLGRRRPAHLLS